MTDPTLILLREARRKKIIEELSTIKSEGITPTIEQSLRIVETDFWLKHINSHNPLLRWLSTQVILTQIAKIQGQSKKRICYYISQVHWR